MSIKIEAQSGFISELCKYYMEFLKDGFKSNRFPKRYIRLTNEKNFRLLGSTKTFNKGFTSVLKKKHS